MNVTITEAVTDGFPTALPSHLSSHLLRDELEHHVGEIVLAVRGDLDAATFRAALEMCDGEGGDLVIDLSAVPFMDSSGLDVIAGTHLRLKGSGGSLCIRNPRRQT